MKDIHTFILNLRNEQIKLVSVEADCRLYDLTKLEIKLLKVLLDNETHTKSELFNVFGKNKSNWHSAQLYYVVSRLREKIPLNIETRSKIGLRLLDDIFIDY